MDFFHLQMKCPNIYNFISCQIISCGGTNGEPMIRPAKATQTASFPSPLETLTPRYNALRASACSAWTMSDRDQLELEHKNLASEPWQITFNLAYHWSNWPKTEKVTKRGLVFWTQTIGASNHSQSPASSKAVLPKRGFLHKTLPNPFFWTTYILITHTVAEAVAV